MNTNWDRIYINYRFVLKHGLNQQIIQQASRGFDVSHSSVGSLDEDCFGSYFQIYGAVQGCQLMINDVNDSQCIIMIIRLS